MLELSSQHFWTLLIMFKLFSTPPPPTLAGVCMHGREVPPAHACHRISLIDSAQAACSGICCVCHSGLSKCCKVHTEGAHRHTQRVGAAAAPTPALLVSGLPPTGRCWRRTPCTDGGQDAPPVLICVGVMRRRFPGFPARIGSGR